MFGNKSVAEWNAEIEKLRAEIAQTKHEQVKRGLTRERKKLKLEDLDDRLLDIQVMSKENSVDIAEEKLAGEKILLQAERDKTKFLKAQHKLTVQGYMTTLEIQSVELSGSAEKLRQLKSVAQTLNHKLAHNPAAQLGLGGGK